MPEKAGWHIMIMLPALGSGRVGYNPPSVLGSIRLCGLPGLPVGIISLYLPFLPAVWPFHRNRKHTQREPPPHGHPHPDVSFLLQEQGSPPTPHGVAVPHGGWSFLRPSRPVGCPPTRPLISMHFFKINMSPHWTIS